MTQQSVEYSKLYELMQRVEAKVEKLDNDIAKIKEDYHSLNTRFNVLQHSELPTQVSKLEVRVDRLESEINSIKLNMATDKKDIESNTMKWTLILNALYKFVMTLGMAGILYKLGW